MVEERIAELELQARRLARQRTEASEHLDTRDQLLFDDAARIATEIAWHRHRGRRRERTTAMTPLELASRSFRVIETGDPDLANQLIDPAFVNQETADDPEDVDARSPDPKNSPSTMWTSCPAGRQGQPADARNSGFADMGVEAAPDHLVGWCGAGSIDGCDLPPRLQAWILTVVNDVHRSSCMGCQARWLRR